MKFLSMIFLGLIVLICQSSYAADNDALKRSLSVADTKLFVDCKTKKVYTPYSTASVNSFSEHKKVNIEKSVYLVLLKNALARTTQSEVSLSYKIKTLTGSDQKNKKPVRIKNLQRAALYAVAQNSTFKSLTPTIIIHQDDIPLVRLSQLNLMRLLQWSYGFACNDADCAPDVRAKRPDSINVEIKLSKNGKRTLNAEGPLKNFINKVSDHEQNMQHTH